MKVVVDGIVGPLRGNKRKVLILRVAFNDFLIHRN